MTTLSDLSPYQAKEFLEDEMKGLLPDIQRVLRHVRKCNLYLKRCDEATFSMYSRNISFLENAFANAEEIVSGRGLPEGVDELGEGVLHIDSSDKGKLGEGSYGVVRKGDLAGTPVAVKIFKKTMTSKLDEILAEAEIMKKTRHPNIVRFIGAFCKAGDEEVRIVSELCDGDLEHVQVMRSNKQLFEANVAKWFCQAARGLAYMHDVLGMVHRDVKPANILLRNGVAQIADFGFTLNVEEISKAKRKGTPAYVAPELWSGYRYERPVDVYAFGMSMYAVFSGVDFDEMYTSVDQIMKECLRGKRPDFPAVNNYVFQPKIQNLIEACWNQDPKKRPTMQQVHDYLKEIYVESLLPPTATPESPAFKFWMSNFGNELVDSVSVFKLLKAIPGGLEMETAQKIMDLLQKDNLSDTVSLKQFNDMCNWYDSFGVWYEQPALDEIIEKIDANPYFVKSMNQTSASSRVCLQFEDTTSTPCFLVRCSSTESRMQPYTITFHDEEQVQDQRIDRVADGFVCTHFSTSIVGKTIFDLIDALKTEDLLGQDEKDGKKVDHIPFEPYNPMYVPDKDY